MKADAILRGTLKLHLAQVDVVEKAEKSGSSPPNIRGRASASDIGVVAERRVESFDREENFTLRPGTYWYRLLFEIPRLPTAKEPGTTQTGQLKIRHCHDTPGTRVIPVFLQDYTTCAAWSTA